MKKYQTCDDWWNISTSDLEFLSKLWQIRHSTCATHSFIHSLTVHCMWDSWTYFIYITCATHTFIYAVTSHVLQIHSFIQLHILVQHLCYKICESQLCQESLVWKIRTHENFKPLKIENHFSFIQYIRVHAELSIYIENTAT